MTVRYVVTAPSPATHRFHVCAEFPAHCQDLVFPSWAPGSYLMREFARNVRDISARAPDGTPVTVERRTRNAWHVATSGPFVLTYQVYAREKSVRTPFCDEDLQFFLPSNLLAFPRHQRDVGFTIEVDVPAGHTAVCPAGPAVTGPGRAAWTFVDVDAMNDAPISIGPFQHTSFDACGVEHHHWIEPGHDGDLERMNTDLRRVVEATAQLFGGALPYPRYDFVTLLMGRGHGGLEHKDGCILLRPRSSFAQPRDYEEFVTLAAHEHFHAWNVKRIHPDTLGPRFEYGEEHYTRDLWWLEGGTVYYEERIAYRAGLVDEPRHLARLAELGQRYQDTGGRRWQSLEDSSFDAWIKLYRPGEDSPNSNISYYLKGAVVLWAMDLELLHRTGGERGVDHLLRGLWERWGRHGRGFPERVALRRLAAEIAGDDGVWTRWYDAHVCGTDDIALAQALDRAGCDWVRAPSRPGSALGVEVSERMVVETVREDGPCAEALTPGDELLTVNDQRVATSGALGERLRALPPGSELNLVLSRDGRIRTRRVVSAAPPPGEARIVLRDACDAARLRVRSAWLSRS
jgi:predicted metalloprotease with PDZ domain